MGEYADKIKKLKRPTASVEFVESTKVYSQLEDIYSQFDQLNGNNKELLVEVSKMITGLIEDMAKGVRITNIDELKIEPKFTTPEVIVPEIKMPSLQIPEPTIIKQDNIFDIYKPSETDIKSDTKYYGYVSKDGRWFIMRESETGIGEQYKYSSGVGEFKKAFSNRKGLNYKYYDEVEL